MKVKLKEAVETSRLLSRKEGLLAGISSGDAAFPSIEVAKHEESEGKLWWLSFLVQANDISAHLCIDNHKVICNEEN